MRHKNAIRATSCIILSSIFLVAPLINAAQEDKEPVAGARHENDAARIVLMHEPGYEVLFGLLHPAAALFKESFSRERAIKEHRTFRQMLSSLGLQTYLIEDLLITWVIQ